MLDAVYCIHKKVELNKLNNTNEVNRTDVSTHDCEKYVDKDESPKENPPQVEDDLQRVDERTNRRAGCPEDHSRVVECDHLRRRDVTFITCRP
jgi:hypothetical protein